MAGWLDSFVFFCILVDGLCPELIYPPGPIRRALFDPSEYQRHADDKVAAAAVTRILDVYAAARADLDNITGSKPRHRYDYRQEITNHE